MTKLAKCRICGGSGQASYLAHHCASQHSEHPSVVNGTYPPLSEPPANEQPRLAKRSNRSIGKASKRLSKQKKKEAIEQKKLRAAANAYRVLTSMPAMLQSIRKGQACFLCGEPMTDTHRKKHEKLKGTVGAAKPPSESSSPESSIWAVSGGLPSLGKRAR